MLTQILITIISSFFLLHANLFGGSFFNANNFQAILEKTGDASFAREKKLMPLILIYRRTAARFWT